ncbi:glycosyltransferase family 2 protein [Phocaeicola plebeius]|jgi:abequosyltransferase|uniref:glycosyltransferase family 2 protein n=1 Tax=Phocaeicola plebeius TaxID=310297 RepID=UPI00320A5878
MEQNKQPLLSICIPTYNRASYLEGAILNIITDNAFGDEVEIIISDNASTDNTEEIAKKYTQKHYNIKYYKNEENIRDKNFMLALQRGNGLYRRLFNDTLRFKERALQKMLDIIRISPQNRPLFFYQNITFLNSNTQKKINNPAELILNTSYWITWIGNFGNWKHIINNIPSPNECAPLLLTQVDWSFKIMSGNQCAQIYFDDYFESIIPNKKGGYNIFNVFINNYLLIIRQYIDKKSIIQKEKYRLFRYFLLKWISSLKNSNKDFTFEKNNIWNILMKEYWYCPYFYIGLIFLYIKNIIAKK